MESTTVQFPAETSNQGANMESVSIAKPLKSFTKDPDAGFRLSRHVAKMDKNKQYTGIKESLGIIVPNGLSVVDALKDCDATGEYLVQALYDLQDKIIRSKLDAGETQILHSDFNYAAMNKFAATLEGIGKLSAEKIESWFASDCKDSVIVFFADQIGKTPDQFSEEQKKQCEQRVNAVRAMLVSLASGKATLASEIIRDKLRAYVDLCNESQVKTRLLARLESIEILTADAL